MPPLPTIPGVYRVTFNWNTVAGVTPKNVIHLSSPLTDEADVMATIVQGAIDSVGQYCYVAMQSAFEIDHVDILKLDGSSATQTFPGLSGLWVTTGGSGNLIPEAALIVKIATAVGGPRGRGRQYIGPLAEAALVDGFISGITLSTISDAWQAFNDVMHADSLTSVGVASYRWADFNESTSFVCRPYMGFQKRRLLQTRP